MPPIECHDDGSSTVTLIETDTAIQATVEGVPDGVDVTVEAVGTGSVAPDNAIGSLSPKQRAAVQAALHIGYDRVPREATIEDVAFER